MKKILISLLIIYAVIVTGCPTTKKTLTRAFNESAKVYQLGTTAAATIGSFYDSGLIPLALKDKLIDGLGTVAENGRKFHNTLVAVKNEFGTSAPPEKLASLDIFFSTTVIEPFLKILTDLGVLNPAVAQKILLAVGALKAAILVISQIFGNGSASYQQGEFINARQYATA